MARDRRVSRIEPFEQHAERYDAWYDAHRAVHQAEVAAIEEVLERPGRGLEVGVGTGRFATALGIGHGVEPALAMARRARQRGVSVVRGVAEALPFADASFDAVLMVAVLAFVDEPGQVMAEARRVLRADGKLVVALLDPSSPVAKGSDLVAGQGPFARAAQLRSAVQVHELIEQAGFRLQDARQTIFDPIEQIAHPPRVREGAGEGLFAVLQARR